MNNSLKCLDGLIAELGGADMGMRSNGPCGLLLEHLEAARRGLLGSMGAEYKSSLEQGKGSIACISDKDARIKMKNTLLGLLESNALPQAP